MQSHQRLAPEKFPQEHGGFSDPATVVEHRTGLVVKPSQTLCQPFHSSPGEELLAFAAGGKGLVEVVVVAVGKLVELGGTAHRRCIPSTLRKKLAKMVCTPRVRQSTAGILMR